MERIEHMKFRERQNKKRRVIMKAFRSERQ